MKKKISTTTIIKEERIDRFSVERDEEGVVVKDMRSGDFVRMSPELSIALAQEINRHAGSKGEQV